MGIARLLVVTLAVTILLTGWRLIQFQHLVRVEVAELQRLRQMSAELEAEWRLLVLEHNTLTSTAEIDASARQDLGMVAPTPDSVVYIQR